jgi:hypothetical protein
LFLGVFLIILSSGVLAASQWSKFPTFGQYAVLWTYTLVFWGVSYWTNKQENLQLTSQTLQTIALLLIPVNFWAIDSFGLWNSPLEWITVGLATITLISITFFQKSTKLPSNYSWFAFLCLCFLHWGWGFLNFSSIAVYLGVAVTTVFQGVGIREQGAGEQGAGEQGAGSRGAGEQGSRGAGEQGSGGAGERRSRGAEEQGSRGAGEQGSGGAGEQGNVYLIFALSVLLGRAIFVDGVPIQELGLAIGMLGWILPQAIDRGAGSRGNPLWLPRSGGAEENYQLPVDRILEEIGAVLLLVGWFVALEGEFPRYVWQAVAVSGLALQFYWQKLCRDWLKRDLLAIFVIGLQALFLIKNLIPLQFKQNALKISVEIAQSQDYPYTVFSVTLFPYVIFFVWLTDWLYRRDRKNLALFGEWLTLALGIGLMLVGSYNPTWRSLNLLLSTITLAYVTGRRLPLRITGIYGTHILSLLTIFSTLDWWFPSLSQPIWASLLVVTAIAEWSIGHFIRTTNHIKTFWYRSCWQIGFVLMGLSYILFADRVPNSIGDWGLVWLLIPVALTFIASRSSGKRRISSSAFSFGALIFLQYLTLWRTETRLIGLGCAVVLMSLSSRYLREKAIAFVHLGFVLSFAIALVWEQLSPPSWYVFIAIATIVFWISRNWLNRRSGSLANLYAEASDRWGIILCVLELILLTIDLFLI